MNTVAFHTLGCKLNFAESSTLIRGFTQSGYSIIDFKDKADIYVIHTCIVTQHAEHKCIASIRQAKKRNPHATIAVIGCMPEVNRAKLEKEGESLILLGNTDKFSLPDIIKSGKAKTIKDKNTFIPSYSSGNRTRTFFKIQDGCDYYCTYCTIPYARGNSRSLNIKETLLHIMQATGNYCNELVLTGVNIGDFGRNNGESLFQLLEALQYADNIRRIRLSSIEPDLLQDNIIELFSKSSKFMPHFHIPLQAGSDKILKLMNRKYDTQLFAKKVKLIKDKIPHACIATDIITGFPSEEEDDFNEGFRFIEGIDISYMHVFTYSERLNTKASEINPIVDPDVKKCRSMKLHRLSEQKKSEFYRNSYGQVYEALFESENHDGYLLGFTPNYIRVKTKFDAKLRNSIVSIMILEEDDKGICLSKPY